MKLATIETRNGDAVAVGLLGDGSLLALAGAAEALGAAGQQVDPLPTSVLDILAGDRLGTVRRLLDLAQTGEDRVTEPLPLSGALHARDMVEFLPPVLDPSIILAQGLAYQAHLDEMGVGRPKAPTAFMKAPSSMIGAGRPIELPATHPDMVDFEGEFSIIIGRTCHNIEADDALDHVAGYTIVNDVSARDWVAPFMQERARHRLRRDLPGWITCKASSSRPSRRSAPILSPRMKFPTPMICSSPPGSMGKSCNKLIPAI